MTETIVSGSFRDPSGFLFRQDGVLYRQVNQTYREHYDQLMASGLYQRLVDAGQLIPHEEVNVKPAADGAYKVLRPEPVAFVAYPYEWAFGQLKDAALTTLAIQQQALQFGMTLKDSSAYNIQFHRGKPVLIDTLSFEGYHPGEPWGAYRQYCEHFLAPLALMSYRDIRLNQLLRVYLDGIPLDLASSLLPRRSRLNFHLLLHLHLHAASQKRYAKKPVRQESVSHKISRTGILGLVDSLESLVSKLTWRPRGTPWADYYTSQDSRSAVTLDPKKQLVSDFLDRVKPASVWDMGANTGLFSRLASDKGIPTLSFDIDPACVEINYQTVKARAETNLLPLLLDLTNPSPGIGWENRERAPLWERGRADMVLALALIHHLAIANNLPLERLARFFSRIGSSLIIEFVPRSDPNAQRLLATRQDVFGDYTRENFEREFGQRFVIQNVATIPNSVRTMYLMLRKQP
ncbi:MAG: SAM-dependent methyltransferase [Chloroflexota bacterium]